MLEPDRNYSVTELIAMFEERLRHEPRRTSEDAVVREQVSLWSEMLVLLQHIRRWNKTADSESSRGLSIKSRARANQA